MATAPRFRFGEFVLSPSEQLLSRGGEPVRLDPKTARLLECLVDHAGEIVSKDALLSEVWDEIAVSDAALSQTIKRLRTALDDDARAPRYVETVHRRGFRFIAPVDRIEMSTPARSAPVNATFVGRDQELAQLAEARESAEQGQRQVVMIRGEMGIGKTTLIDEFVATLPTEWRVMRSQCVEQYGSGEPYMPVLEAVEEIVKSAEGPQVVNVLRRHAPTLLGQMPWIVDDQEARDLRDQLAGGTRPRMLRETASALEALCDKGLLLIIEDLHWSDPATLDLVALIARRRGSANLMILGSFRDGEAIAYGHPVIALTRDLEAKGQCLSLPLEPLTMDTIEAFLHRRLASEDVQASLVEQLHDRTDGNPLFLQTLVDHLIDVGSLVDDSGHWQLRAAADLKGFPSSLRQMIGAFLDRIDAEDLEILTVASLVGVAFSAASVAAALERSAADLEPIEAACARLVDRWHVLRPAADLTWPDGTTTSRYRFAHALFHDALYDRIASSKRRRLHQLVGERLEQGYGSQTRAIAAELAAHFERSGDVGRAVTHLIEAAFGARHRFAENEAIGYLSTALERVVRLPPSSQRDLQEVWIRLSLSFASGLVHGIDPEEGDENVVARIEPILDELPDELLTYPLLLAIAGLHFLRSDVKRLRPVAERFLALAAATEDRASQIEANTLRSMADLLSGRFANAAAAAESAWKLYREQSEEHAARGIPTTRGWREVGTRIVGTRVTSFGFHGQPDRAAGAWQDWVDTASPGLVHPYNPGILRIGMAACEIAGGNLSAAVEHNAEALSVGQEHEIAGVLNAAILQRTWLELARGELKGDPAKLPDRWPTLRRNAILQPVTNLYIVWSCAITGDIDGGFAELDSMRRYCTARELHWCDAELLRSEAELLIRRGRRDDIERAEILLRDAVAVASRQEARFFALHAAMTLFRLDPERPGVREALARTYNDFPEGTASTLLTEASAMLDQH